MAQDKSSYQIISTSLATNALLGGLAGTGAGLVVGAANGLSISLPAFLNTSKIMEFIAINTTGNLMLFTWLGALTTPIIGALIANGTISKTATEFSLQNGFKAALLCFVSGTLLNMAGVLIGYDLLHQTLNVAIETNQLALAAFSSSAWTMYVLLCLAGFTLGGAYCCCKPADVSQNTNLVHSEQSEGTPGSETSATYQLV